MKRDLVFRRGLSRLFCLAASAIALPGAQTPAQRPKIHEMLTEIRDYFLNPAPSVAVDEVAVDALLMIADSPDPEEIVREFARFQERGFAKDTSKGFLVCFRMQALIATLMFDTDLRFPEPLVLSGGRLSLGRLPDTYNGPAPRFELTIARLRRVSKRRDLSQFWKLDRLAGHRISPHGG